MGVVPSKVQPVDLGPDENTTAAEWVALLTAPVPESEQRVPYMFFAGYVRACANSRWQQADASGSSRWLAALWASSEHVKRVGVRPAVPAISLLSRLSCILPYQVTASVVSLGGGVLVGMRSFENSAAMEALDKMEKPTAQAEALAARVAGRAFAWGTAVSIGTAALTVLATRYALQVAPSAHLYSPKRGDQAPSLHPTSSSYIFLLTLILDHAQIRSMSDFGDSARSALDPFNTWLERKGEWLQARGEWLESCGQSLGDFGNAIGSAPRRVWHWVSPPIAIEQQTPPALEPPPAPRDENG